MITVLDVDLVVIGGGLAEKLGQNLADRIAAAAARWTLHPNPELAWCPLRSATTPASSVLPHSHGRP